MDRYCKEEGLNPDSGLMMHTAPGFSNYNAVTPDALNLIYNAADVMINTSVAEGFGLPAFEAAAVGVPTILGYHSAHRELWQHGDSYSVYADGSETSTGVHLDRAVMDAHNFTAEIRRAWINPGLRHDRGYAAKSNVLQDKFNWDNIAKTWDDLLTRMRED